MSTYVKSINFFSGKPENSILEFEEVSNAITEIQAAFQKADVKSVGIFHSDGKVFSYAHKVTGRRENFSEI